MGTCFIFVIELLFSLTIGPIQLTQEENVLFESTYAVSHLPRSPGCSFATRYRV